jgi:hypothetical protein
MQGQSTLHQIPQLHPTIDIGACAGCDQRPCGAGIRGAIDRTDRKYGPGGGPIKSGAFKGDGSDSNRTAARLNPNSACRNSSETESGSVAGALLRKKNIESNSGLCRSCHAVQFIEEVSPAAAAAAMDFCFSAVAVLPGVRVLTALTSPAPKFGLSTCCHA